MYTVGVLQESEAQRASSPPRANRVITRHAVNGCGPQSGIGEAQPGNSRRKRGADWQRAGHFPEGDYLVMSSSSARSRANPVCSGLAPVALLSDGEDTACARFVRRPVILLSAG